MGKIFRSLCQVAFLFLCIAWHPLEDKPCTIFLSNQCTGTNWAIGCLQVLTKRPCHYLHEASKGCAEGSGFNFLDLDLDFAKDPIFRTHYNPPPSLRKSGNKLIAITRNYREVFLRRLTANPEREIDRRYLDIIQSGKLMPYIERFLRLYNTYERWPKADRYMFSYEDLIENPEQTLKDLLHFMGESKEHLEHLMAYLDDYKQQMLATYNELQGVWGGSMSKGEDVLYHTRHADPIILHDIDDQFRACVSPKLWQAYFAHYAID